MEDVPTVKTSSRLRARLRFAASWVLAGVLVAAVVPQVVSVSWHGVLPVLEDLRLSELLGLVGLWALGLYVHSFVLVAAAPNLSHRRALTLNVTGSAVANVVPLGGAAGVELNRRMMRAWGIDTRTFAGYTVVTNLWDVGIKLILPVVAVGALAHAGEHVAAPLKLAALGAGIGFVALVAAVTVLLLSSRGPMEEIRRQSRQLVANGWLRMSVGMVGYVALQALLLGWCLHLTGAGNNAAEILAGFALERLITILPITPGGVGVADLGLVSVLLALGGDPVGVTAGAVLYRVFVFLVEIPVGGGALGLWLVGHRQPRPAGLDRLDHRGGVRTGEVRRIAHVTDVFLPRLGGIETHVDDLVRHQRERGLEADVLTPTPGDGPDPAWVRRLPAAGARAEIGGYDVVHVHLSVLSPYSISVARAAMAAGVPTLITVHSMWAGASTIVRLAALASLRRWPVAWSAVSAAAAEAFRRSLGGAPVDVLPNAIDVASWRQAGATARKGSDPLTIVSVMRLMPRKRPLPLLRLFTDVRRLVPGRDVRLLIVGDGPLRGRLERYVRRHGLGDVVTITGRVDREEVRQLLRSGAVYLAPAPKESFGLAVLEARCAGLPVVASRRSGVREFIRDRVDGLLVDGDREMAIATATLLTDDLLRERIQAHNDRVAPAYDWTDVLDTTMRLYRTAGERVAVPTVPVPVQAPDGRAVRA